MEQATPIWETPAWEMILHHLDAASSYAEEGQLAELQRGIDALRNEAALLAASANSKASGA